MESLAIILVSFSIIVSESINYVRDFWSTGACEAARNFYSLGDFLSNGAAVVIYLYYSTAVVCGTCK